MKLAAEVPVFTCLILSPSSDPCSPRVTARLHLPAAQPYKASLLYTTTLYRDLHDPHLSTKSHLTMSANFAPYQDVPETQRVLSPLTSPRASLDRTRKLPTITPPTRPYTNQDYFDADEASPDVERAAWTAPAPSTAGFGRPRADVDMFTTSLGWRLDYEACLAYLLLPPAGGVLLLMLEHQSDYVRFHAWQSALLFAFVFVVHVIFSWSSLVSWVLFVGDVGGIGWLTWRAYQDG
jgi:uncharacterized membrane protein